jgi:hypothetical protein
MSSNGEEDEKNVTCARCFSNINGDIEYYDECEICNNIICSKCSEKGYYMHTSEPCDNQGLCYICMKDDGVDCPKLPIYFQDWRTLHKKYKLFKKKQTKYITELEAEIKLLKNMLNFRPGAEGYIIARENFKQLVDKNDAIDDNQYNDCDDYDDVEDVEDVEDDGNN